MLQEPKRFKGVNFPIPCFFLFQVHAFLLAPNRYCSRRAYHKIFCRRALCMVAGRAITLQVSEAWQRTNAGAGSSLPSPCQRHRNTECQQLLQSNFLCGCLFGLSVAYLYNFLCEMFRVRLQSKPFGDVDGRIAVLLLGCSFSAELRQLHLYARQVENCQQPPFDPSDESFVMPPVPNHKKGHLLLVNLLFHSDICLRCKEHLVGLVTYTYAFFPLLASLNGWLDCCFVRCFHHSAFKWTARVVT